jgi:hypothetical protein
MKITNKGLNRSIHSPNRVPKLHHQSHQEKGIMTHLILQKIREAEKETFHKWMEIMMKMIFSTFIWTFSATLTGSNKHFQHQELLDLVQTWVNQPMDRTQDQWTIRVQCTGRDQ